MKVIKINETEIRLNCDCGLIHLIKADNDGKLNVETMYKAGEKANDKKDNDRKKDSNEPEKRKSIFSFGK